MKLSLTQTVLVLVISALAVVATVTGIFTNDRGGEYIYRSIRGQDIIIYGKGLYKHMSSEMAVQGIAQDYITLFVAVPLLLIALYQTNKGSRRWSYVLTGVIAYIFGTYVFYLNLGMYNSMFLVYVGLLGCSFFALITQLINQSQQKLVIPENKHDIFRHAGIFLMVNAVLIALLWLSVILPPLIDRTIFPKQLEHYTTLPVQGFDLAIFLPLSFVAGFMAWKAIPNGNYFVLIYCIALTILMIALCAKILFMGMSGVNVFPVIFIMPTIASIALYFSLRMILSI